MVDPNSVTMRMNLEIRENLTRAFNQTLPLANFFVDSTNSTRVLQPLETTLQTSVPGAHISSLKLLVRTALIAPSTGTWLLQENYTLVIVGANTNLGASAISNLAFLSMKIQDSIRLRNLEINQVGNQYLLQPLKGLPTTRLSRYFLNGGTYIDSNIPGNFTAQFNLLDFSWVPPISQWTGGYQPLQRSTNWTLTVPPPYNMTVGITPFENAYFPIYTALFKPSLELSAPAKALASGSTLSFDLPSAADVIMPVIVAALLGVSLVVFLLDRRLTRPRRAKRKKQ